MNICAHPERLEDRVHERCWRTRRRPVYLLALPQTCRWIYLESIPQLYKTVTLFFSQHLSCSLLPSKFPKDHRAKIRHLVVSLYFSSNGIFLRGLEQLCRGLTTGFSPLLEVCINLLTTDPFGTSREICTTDDIGTMEWLSILWSLSEKFHLKLFIQPMDWRAVNNLLDNAPPPPDHITGTVIDFDELKKRVQREEYLGDNDDDDDRKRDAVLRIVYRTTRDILCLGHPRPERLVH